MDVEDKTSGGGGSVRLQESFRRAESPGSETACLQKSLERLHHTFIVFSHDDRSGDFVRSHLAGGFKRLLTES